MLGLGEISQSFTPELKAKGDSEKMLSKLSQENVSSGELRKMKIVHKYGKLAFST